jgi:RNA polymerase sigma-70 factor (ECF subfamily)
VERAALDDEIRRAVLDLPQPYRTVVLLRYMEDLPYEAIAEALEMPLGTVKTLLHRARARLRVALSCDTG